MRGSQAAGAANAEEEGTGRCDDELKRELLELASQVGHTPREIDFAVMILLTLYFINLKKVKKVQETA